MNTINQKNANLKKHDQASWGGKPVVLVGMMGVGKSTIGRRLAVRLNMPFVDVDDEIILSANMDIVDIFEKHGEPHFRDGERKVIERLLDGKQKIIATGGGAFIEEQTRAMILQKSITIWLKADLDVLVNRVKRRDSRPLLKNGDPKTILSGLSKIRDPIYALAQHHISTDTITHDKTVQKIIEALDQ